MCRHRDVIIPRRFPCSTNIRNPLSITGQLLRTKFALVRLLLLLLARELINPFIRAEVVTPGRSVCKQYQIGCLEGVMTAGREEKGGRRGGMSSKGGGLA